MKPQGQLLPLKLERQANKYRESQLIGADTQEESRDLRGKQCHSREIWCSTDNCWRLSVDNPEIKTPRRPSHQSAPNFCEFYVLGVLPTSYSEYWRKPPPHASRKEEEKKAFWNISEYCVLKVCPQHNLTRA